MPAIRNVNCGGHVGRRHGALPSGHANRFGESSPRCCEKLEETIMGRGILLWLLGVPIPIIILLALIWH
jgi:hypothetical protein